MLIRMPRWWVVGGLVALVVSSLGGVTTWSYLKTAWRGVGETIRDATPIAFDLQRLHEMIRDLEPEIRRNQQVVAQLEVEVEYLGREVATMQAEQDQAVAQMRKLREALEADTQLVKLGDQEYTKAQVERDLQRRLDHYEQQKSQFEAKTQLWQQRQRTLEAASKKVFEYRRQYEQLVAKAEELQAELALVEAAQAAGSMSLDSNKLAQSKQLAQEVEKRIRVLQRLVDQQRRPEGEIPLDVETRPAKERFDELFAPSEQRMVAQP